MFRKIFLGLIILFSGIFLSGCTLKKVPAALQVDTAPAANVFVNGKLLGKTPYSGSNWKSEEITLKLIPESSTEPLISWEGKIKLTSGVLTLVTRELSVSENGSAGEILTLEKIKDKKIASLFVVSDPDGALISIDGEAKGFSPLFLEQVGIGDHLITVTKEGYEERNIKARTIAGFKLIMNTKLAQKGEVGTTSTPSATPIPTEKLKITPTVAPISKATISPTPKPTGIATGAVQILIKETPTGWLRVRQEASTASSEVAKVNPGEKYDILEEKSVSGTIWYKIRYESGKEGWVSGQYASKL